MGSSDDRVYAAERIIQKRIRKVKQLSEFILIFFNC